MKKFITLLLVLTGMVSTAMAQKFYFGLEIAGISSSSVKVYRYGAEGADNWANPAAATDEGLKFGRHWYSVDLNGQPNAIVRVGANDDDSSDNIVGIDTSKYYYVSSDKSGGNSDNRYNVGTIENPFLWQHMRFLSNFTSYEGTDDNMVNPSDNKFYYELTKATIGANDIYFRFRQGDFVPLKDDGSSLRNFAIIHPTANNAVIDIAGGSTSYYQAATTSWAWKVVAPSYDYEKVVITAEYINDGGYKWKISADAYITKTVSGTNKYATLGCSVPLEIVEANNVTAYPLTANASTGKITEGEAITTIPANEGALLENETGSDKTIRAKVLASAVASASNQLVAFTGTGNLTQPGDGKTYYILSEKDNHVGFYKVNTTYGNAMGANTAYLSVVGVLSRSAFFFDDETTGIEAVESNSETVKENAREYYNLNGQRVMNPSKGLYIVNGKKVIIK